MIFDSFCDKSSQIRMDAKLFDSKSNKNTLKSKITIWKQFKEFCNQHNFSYDSTTSIADLSEILKSWGCNMKKVDGRDYKEIVVKYNWNIIAKLLQQLYQNEYNIQFDPFKDIEFLGARQSRDRKRKMLQSNPESRKKTSDALSRNEMIKIIRMYKEDDPDGLQRKVFHALSFALGWRALEATKSLITFFVVEHDDSGNETGRLIYKSLFSRIEHQHSIENDVTLKVIAKSDDEEICPVRLYKKLISKRGDNINTNRLFLTVNPFWNRSSWFKNMPLGKNLMCSWTKSAAIAIGIDTSKRHITNISYKFKGELTTGETKLM